VGTRKRSGKILDPGKEGEAKWALGKIPISKGEMSKWRNDTGRVT